MFHPHAWQAWSAFGTGPRAIGCATSWTPRSVLELQYPTSVEAKVKGYDPKCTPRRSPPASVKFEFPAKGDRGPITLYLVRRLLQPAEARGTGARGEPRRATAASSSATTAASSMASGGGGFRVFPESTQGVPEEQARLSGGKGPPKTITRRRAPQGFAGAIRPGRPAVISPTTAARSPRSRCWQSSACGSPAKNYSGTDLTPRFTNNDEANKLLDPPYRKGWKL